MGLDTYYKLLLSILNQFWICAGLLDLHLNVLSIFSLALFARYRGPLTWIKYPKRYSLTHLLSFL